MAGQLLFYLLNLLFVVIGTWLITRLLDHRKFTDLGLFLNQAWWIDFGFGLALGAGLMTLIFAAEWQLGWVQVLGYQQVAYPGLPFGVAVLEPLVLFIAVGVNEELLARGYQLRNLAEGFCFPQWGSRGAILMGWVLSSCAFGLLHIFNPNSTWVSTVALMLAGLFLGLGFVLTGSLAIPIGLHISWNFFQGNVFGFRVSGNDLSPTSLIAIQQIGPSHWTGGAFGPEAGLIGISAILLGCIAVGVWVRWRYGAVKVYEPLAIYIRRGFQEPRSEPTAT